MLYKCNPNRKECFSLYRLKSSERSRESVDELKCWRTWTSLFELAKCQCFRLKEMLSLLFSMMEKVKFTLWIPSRNLFFPFFFWLKVLEGNWQRVMHPKGSYCRTLLWNESNSQRCSYWTAWKVSSGNCWTVSKLREQSSRTTYFWKLSPE